MSSVEESADSVPQVLKKWIVRTPLCQGNPRREDVEIIVEELPSLKNGGIYLARVQLPLLVILIIG